MPLTLYIDREAWRAHQERFIAERSGLVPVAKGNGYGFTLPILAQAAADLGPGVDQIAVGTAAEALQVLEVFPRDVVLLEPHLPGTPWIDLPDRVVRTAGSVDAVRELVSFGQRMVIDCCTSMHRQGVERSELTQVGAALGGRSPEGYSLHLPTIRSARVQRAREIDEWARALREAGLDVPVLYVSHLTAAELAELRERHPGLRIRPRIGTDLWLGDRTAIQARATVLDVMAVARGERIGYLQGRLRRGGWVVVVAGGAVQGVGLEAPHALRGLLPRAKEAGRSGLRMMNRALSPFDWQGKRQWFAEPPHMSMSMLYMPAGTVPPEPGAELKATLRFTATHFDSVRMV